jgi:hypothetical protein
MCVFGRETDWMFPLRSVPNRSTTGKEIRHHHQIARQQELTLFERKFKKKLTLLLPHVKFFLQKIIVIQHVCFRTFQYVRFSMSAFARTNKPRRDQ